MSALSLIIQVVAYDDEVSTSNPTQVPIQWRRSMPNLPVENPETRRYTLDPAATVTILDGSRSLGVDNTTEFSLALSTIDASRYRMTWTDGTDPGFRTDRALNLNGVPLTLTMNANLSVTITGGAGGFSSVVVGDEIFLPGPTTGDSSTPFSPLNEGYWTVISASANSITIVRAAGTVFSGSSETVTPTAVTQLQAFTAAGVQVGDTVEISAGFSAATLRSYDLLAVNPGWIEFRSTAPLGEQSGILPAAAGLAIYTQAKRFLFVQSDQEIVVRENGDTGNTNRVVPVIPGDKNFPGLHIKIGPVWKLVLVNRSSARAVVMVASAE